MLITSARRFTLACVALRFVLCVAGLLGQPAIAPRSCGSSVFCCQLRAQLDDSEGEEHTVEGKSLEGYCFESMPPAIVNDTMGYFAARSLEGECIESMPPAIGNNTMDYFAARWCRVRTDERGRNHGC